MRNELLVSLCWNYHKDAMLLMGFYSTNAFPWRNKVQGLSENGEYTSTFLQLKRAPSWSVPKHTERVIWGKTWDDATQWLPFPQTITFSSDVGTFHMHYTTYWPYPVWFWTPHGRCLTPSTPRNLNGSWGCSTSCRVGSYEETSKQKPSPFIT